MLEFMEGKASERKLRLFACGCCRRVWPVMDRQCRDMVELSERFSDGEIGDARMAAASAVADQAVATLERRSGPETASAGAARAAAWAVRLRGRIASQASYAAMWAEDWSSWERTWQGGERVGSGTDEVRTDLAEIKASQADSLRCVLGNPFRPVAVDPQWLTSTVVALARMMYESRDFSPMPILADALQDADCDNEDVLSHCRQPGEHVRGCHVVDLILGKN